MTCRLLCALLVLALCCCCPSVCGADSTEDIIVVDLEDEEQVSGIPPLPQQPPVADDKANIQAVGNDSGQSPLLLERAQGKGHSDPSTRPVGKSGNGGGEGSGSSSTGTNPNEVSNTLQAGGNKGTTGLPSDKRLSEEPANSESEDSTEETTTTTTKAPSTTTTTTTQAPSTTTTEAPTTTTTRAPSRLREIDGSLSSSAWVCAPLLLAASALAYTALG
ncbi:mucin TcMUCII [Trypanosoma cruzi]|nr:mucin TcMUCII [Trypanosoma cruzi]